jgi:hypothetical protein
MKGKGEDHGINEEGEMGGSTSLSLFFWVT